MLAEAPNDLDWVLEEEPEAEPAEDMLAEAPNDLDGLLEEEPEAEPAEDMLTEELDDLDGLLEEPDTEELMSGSDAVSRTESGHLDGMLEEEDDLQSLHEKAEPSVELELDTQEPEQLESELPETEDELLDEFAEQLTHSSEEAQIPEPTQLQNVDELLEALEAEGDEFDADLEEDVEIDLGDDPLADEDIDLSEEEELTEIDLVTPSEELSSYPELQMDESEAEEISLDDDSESPISETERALAESLGQDDASSLLDELDDDGEDVLDFGGDFDDLDGPDFEIELDEDASPDSAIVEQSAAEQTPEEAPLSDEALADEDFPEFDEEDALAAMDAEPEEPEVEESVAEQA
ncbi:hypothetical protein CWB98_23385, partial [Pseudoalteromonas rubra]